MLRFIWSVAAGYAQRHGHATARRGVIVLLFALNTAGNLMAMDLRETLIFTPVRLVAALLAWRVALGNDDTAS